MNPLVLSLFPGIGLLDMAFEQEGFCVVRGPDLLWGGDIRRFHPPRGVFQGVIGGPPCQAFSPIGNVNKARWGVGSVMGDLIPEFRRVVQRAAPEWWVMENSPRAYAPLEGAYSFFLDAEWLGERQHRKRRFWTSHLLHIEVPALVGVEAGSERTVCSVTVDHDGSRAREGGERTLEEMLVLQGLPETFFPKDVPLTTAGKRKMIGNGVPLPMGRAVAKAVKRAMYPELEVSDV